MTSLCLVGGEPEMRMTISFSNLVDKFNDRVRDWKSYDSVLSDVLACVQVVKHMSTLCVVGRPNVNAVHHARSHSVGCLHGSLYKGSERILQMIIKDQRFFSHESERRVTLTHS